MYKCSIKYSIRYYLNTNAQIQIYKPNIQICGRKIVY